jgi:hypothetical protein
MKIMVVFYSLHVCPWIPGERKIVPIFSFFRKNFFSDFSEKCPSTIWLPEGAALKGLKPFHLFEWNGVG